MRNIERSNIFRFLLISSLLLQSCSSGQIGNKLSTNFDNPSDIFLQDDDSTGKSKQKSNLEKSVEGDTNSAQRDLIKSNKVAKPLQEKTIKKEINKSKTFDSFKNKKIQFYKPQPYRIIIKLSGANPSAPAEKVTKALRQAGIEFEVERIERFGRYSDSQTLPSKR